MKRRERTVYCVLALCLFFLAVPELIAAAAAKRPSTAAELALYKGSDRQQLLEEGARKEGALTFYTSGILKQAVRPIVDAFEKKYPFIKVEIWRAGTDAMVPRITEEFTAGKHIFDTVEGTQANMMILQKAGIVQPFISPNIAFMEEGAVTKAAGGGAIAVAFRATGIGIGFNTKLTNKNQLPKKYQDLLDPKWKGKMPIAGSHTGASWVAVMAATLGEDFIKKLATQDCIVHMVSANALLDMVINGEYAFSPTIFDSHVMASREKGAPVDWLPLEPVFVNVGQIALARQAPHPHAALLFADFEMSKESAEIHRSKGYAPLRVDVKPLTPSYKKFYGSDSVDDVKREQELFSGLFIKR